MDWLQTFNNVSLSWDERITDDAIEAVNNGYTGKIINLYKTDINGNVCSDIACKKNNIAFIKFVLSQYELCYMFYLCRPLRYAILQRNVDVVRILLKHGANPNEIVSGWGALIDSSTENEIEIIRLLVQYGLTVNDNSFQLYLACSRGNLKIVKILCDAYETCDKVRRHDELLLPIEIAARNGHIKIVKYLIEKIGLLPYDSFLFAIKGGHKNIVDYLYTFSTTNFSESALSTPKKNKSDSYIAIAISQGHGLNVVKRLVENGDDIHHRSRSGISALHVACNFGYTDIVKYLVDLKCALNCAEKKGLTALHIACNFGHTDIVKYLMDLKCELNCTTGKGATPLMIACRENHFEIAKLLLDAGASPNIKNNDGLTAISFATSNNIKELLK
jgi:ankyrin repeat protein